MNRSLNDNNKRVAPSWSRFLGTILLFLGVSVWPVGYFLLPWAGLASYSNSELLLFHLMGVVPGSLLRHADWVMKFCSYLPGVFRNR